MGLVFLVSPCGWTVRCGRQLNVMACAPASSGLRDGSDLGLISDIVLTRVVDGWRLLSGTSAPWIVSMVRDKIPWLRGCLLDGAMVNFSLVVPMKLHWQNVDPMCGIGPMIMFQKWLVILQHLRRDLHTCYISGGGASQSEWPVLEGGS